VATGVNPSSTPASSGRSGRRSTHAHVGILIFAVGLCSATYIFVLVQILPPQDAWLASYLPFRGHDGGDAVLPGLNYTQLLEASGAASFFGLFLHAFGRSRLASNRRRVLGAFALPLKFFGTLIAAIVYTETHLLWGELWYGVKLLDVYPQGFPWGNERVASNLCFFHGGDYIASYGSHCWFFNYDQLLLVSVLAAVAGWVISNWPFEEEEQQLQVPAGPAAPNPY